MPDVNTLTIAELWEHANYYVGAVRTDDPSNLTHNAQMLANLVERLSEQVSHFRPAVDFFRRVSEDVATPTAATGSIKTWTYSQVNPGGADVTHGLTFTGTDDEWAEHLADLTYQGIEPYNAKITAPVSALGTDYPATPEGFAAAQAEADRMADAENERIAAGNLANSPVLGTTTVTITQNESESA
jgi:hypothetical protein